ncbi:MAG: hypothetical protein M3Q65_14580 [Chloroflexota bacterium]|nr:hypothetical protein [Chloroflexota bacterium]
MPVRCPSCARVVPEETGTCSRCGASLVVPLRLSWVARLFWACPACGTESSLAVHQPFFGQPGIGCRACGAAWALDPTARMLAQIDGETPQTDEPRPIEEWLARLPAPLSWRPLPAPRLLIVPGETCLVRIEQTRMLAPRQSVRQRQPIGRVEIVPGVYERVATDPLGPSPQQLSTAARGPFFVTDRRIVFMGDRKHVEVPLARLDAVEVDEGYLLLHRAARTDTFGFSSESVVKVRAAILTVQDQTRGGAQPETAAPGDAGNGTGSAATGAADGAPSRAERV